MAFILTPRFAPAYQAPQCNPFGFCAPVSRPTYSYRISRPQPRRPDYSPFNHFLTQVDELLSDIDHAAQRQAQIEAQREAYRQQQQREHALRAKFAISQNEKGWQLDGDVHGFEQENISIEVTDEHTLKVAGNTEWRSEAPEQQQSTAEQHMIGGTEDKTNDTPVTESKAQSNPQSEPEIDRPATPSSDAGSQKSYQAFVEDDFEDIAAEASSIFSTRSEESTTATPNEPKGKEKAVEESPVSESAVVKQQQSGVPAEQVQQQQQQQPQRKERAHGSFEQTFTFPERIDADNVSASFKDGVLRITVPKAPTPQIRRIALL